MLWQVLWDQVLWDSGQRQEDAGKRSINPILFSRAALSVSLKCLSP